MGVKRKKSRWKRVSWEIRYQLACWILRGLFLCTYIFPLRWAFPLLDVIGGRIGWHLAGKHRRKMLDNLTFSFKESLTPQDRRRISQESFRNLIRGFVEFAYYNVYTKKIDPYIQVEGRENLDKALSLGKGVIAITAHLGNFIFMCVKMNTIGLPFSTIIKEPAHPGFARLLRKARDTLNVQTIPLDPPLSCQREIMRALRRGETVCIIADQNQKRGGVLVKFLGRIMAMPVGPAVYHLKTGAPILPIFIIRKDYRRHTIIIGQPLGFELRGDEDHDVFIITEKVTQVIESYVRQYPEQWPWISKRRIKTRTKRRSFLEQQADSSKRFG